MHGHGVGHANRGKGDEDVQRKCDPGRPGEPRAAQRRDDRGTPSRTVKAKVPRASVQTDNAIRRRSSGSGFLRKRITLSTIAAMLTVRAAAKIVKNVVGWVASRAAAGARPSTPARYSPVNAEVTSIGAVTTKGTRCSQGWRVSISALRGKYEIASAIIDGDGATARRLMHDHMATLAGFFEERYPGLMSELVDWR